MANLNLKNHEALLRATSIVVLITGLNAGTASSQQITDEVFYRIDKSEFATVIEHLNAGISAKFIFAAPDTWKLMPNNEFNYSDDKNSLPGYPGTAAITPEIPVPVEATDDGETIVLHSDETSDPKVEFILEPIPGRYTNPADSYFKIINEDGDELMTTYGVNSNNSSPTTYFYCQKDRAQSKYRAYFDEDNGYMLSLRTYPKEIGNASLGDKAVYINPNIKGGFFIKSPVTAEEFEKADKRISLYRKDYFNFTFENQVSPVTDGNLNIVYTNKDLRGSSNTVDLKYIINSGEEVGIDDLIASPNTETIYYQGVAYKNQPTSCRIPVGENTTTIWAVPVTTPQAAKSSESTPLPIGRIFKGVFAQNENVSTLITLPDAETADGAEAEYFTIQGQRASDPLLPGLYIKRNGTHTTKILVK